MKTQKPRPRNADATQKRILESAKREFARLGLGGARVDAIALKAKANDLQAVVAGFGEERVDEYRVAFSLIDESEVAHGVVWPRSRRSERRVDVDQ